MENKINKLRSKIDDIDSKLLSLLEQRLDLAVAIGLLKQKQGFEVEQNARENVVLERAGNSRHSEANISVFQAIINSSKIEQIKNINHNEIAYDLHIGIIGFGRFGQFMAKGLTQNNLVNFK